MGDLGPFEKLLLKWGITDNCNNIRNRSWTSFFFFLDVCKINNGGCSQICKPHGTNGRVCECSKGYKLVNGSSTICEDIDECLVPGTCSQVCRNLKGDYKCECFADYTLTSQHYCKAFGAPRPELLLSMRSELRSYHLDTHNYFSVANGDQVSSPSALDFDHRNNKAYHWQLWSEDIQCLLCLWPLEIYY